MAEVPLLVVPVICRRVLFRIVIVCEADIGVQAAVVVLVQFLIVQPQVLVVRAIYQHVIMKVRVKQ